MFKSQIQEILDNLEDNIDYKVRISQIREILIPAILNKPILEEIEGNVEIVCYEKINTYKVAEEEIQIVDNFDFYD
jgi:hypothetical protein